MNHKTTTDAQHGFVWYTLTVGSILMAVVIVVLMLWYAREVLLLAFAGILLAVFLHSLSDWLSVSICLSERWAFTLVLVVLITGFGIGAWLLAPHVAEQIDILLQTLPQAVQQFEESLQNYGWGQALLTQKENAEQQMSFGTNLLKNITEFISTSLGALASAAVVLFVGLFLAAQPGIYTAGLVRLVPVDQRQRAQEVLHTIGQTLRWWLVGQIAAMCLIGSLMTLGLWLLRVPLALTLGLLAAVLAFIPYIGAVLTAVPAVLLALAQSPSRAFYVFVFYIAIQVLESYVLTPLIERRTVLLPPALTILAQVLLGVLLGGLGLVLATPLVAIALVLVKMLYIENVLGESVQVSR